MGVLATTQHGLIDEQDQLIVLRYIIVARLVNEIWTRQIARRRGTGRPPEQFSTATRLCEVQAKAAEEIGQPDLSILIQTWCKSHRYKCIFKA